MALIAGVDEAGRGPAIGPLVICCYLLDESKLPQLRELGVKDSKLLSPNRRKELFSELKKIGKPLVKEIEAHRIDKWMDSGKSLNLLELTVMAKLIDDSKAESVFVDAMEADEDRLKAKLEALLASKPKMVAENKADFKYEIVGAASICAKVTRDGKIESYKKSYGDFGSGYPSDPKTKKFLKEWAKSKKPMPIIVRNNWATIRNLVGEQKQSKLGEWK